MIFSDYIFVRVAIGLLGVCGFFVADHIRKHKVKQVPLVCMAGFDCHTVVHSDYSRFFGIPVEILGMIYYAVIALGYLVLTLVFGEVLPQLVVNIAAILSLAAFLFSVYLIIVQVLVLKKGCSWCFVSAFISISIFLLTLNAYHIDYVSQFFK
jgi:uncharacterized membrane protein